MARTKRDLFRLALHYAIEEREGFMGCTDPSDLPHQRASELVTEWKALLKEEFGEITEQDRLTAMIDSGEIKSVPISELMAPQTKPWKDPF